MAEKSKGVEALSELYWKSDPASIGQTQTERVTLEIRKHVLVRESAWSLREIVRFIILAF